MPRKITKWEARDGTLHDSEAAAKYHEANVLGKDMFLAEFTRRFQGKFTYDTGRMLWLEKDYWVELLRGQAG